MSTTTQTAPYMLTEDNYLEWQRHLEVSFLKSGCRRVVQDGVPELPEIQETNAHRRLLQLDDLARGLILETIPHMRTDLIDTINSAPDAHSALEELKNLFNSSSAAHLLVLNELLTQFKWNDNDTFELALSHYHNLLSCLALAGQPLNDTIAALCFLSTLPPSLKAFQ